jgi:PST family polysaccharide transporter
MLVMTVTADWMVPTLLGWQWAPAAPIFAWLGLAGLVQPYNSATGWLFVSQGRTATLALTVPMWWYAGRSGPVSFSYIWRTAAVFLPSLIVTAGVLYLFHDRAPFGRFAGLAVSAVLAYAVYVAVLAILPTGREILGEAIQLATQPGPLRRFRPKALSQNG